MDACVVHATGQRRVYIDALMSFADRAAAVGLAPAFGRRRHLFRRIVLISKESAMSNTRVAVSSAAMGVVVGLAAWYAMGVFPLSTAYASQVLLQRPGPLELAAKPVGPDNPIPERLHYVTPRYPEAAQQENAFAYVTLRITLDGSGNVAESRLAGFGLKTARYEVRIPVSGGAQESLNTFLDRAELVPNGGGDRIRAEALRPLIDTLIDAAAGAVQQWRYAPPAQSAVTFDVSMSFAPAAGGVATGTAGAPPPSWDDALRVGGTIKPPTKIKDVRPVYPEDAREAKTQGVVIIDVKIDELGHVADARVLRSIPALDQAALDAVRQWEFMPTLLNGNPTPIAVTVTVSFTLK